jgi:hypothetical protein
MCATWTKEPWVGAEIMDLLILEPLEDEPFFFFFSAFSAANHGVSKGT